MKKILKLIGNDDDLQKLLHEVFLARGRPYLCAERVTALANIIYNKYDIDMEVYT